MGVRARRDASPTACRSTRRQARRGQDESRGPTAPLLRRRRERWRRCRRVLWSSTTITSNVAAIILAQKRTHDSAAMTLGFVAGRHDRDDARPRDGS